MNHYNFFQHQLYKELTLMSHTTKMQLLFSSQKIFTKIRNSYATDDYDENRF